MGDKIFIPAKNGTFSPKDIKLEGTLYKPKGTGPFPLVILNHGSTDNGNIPATTTFKWQWTSNFFVERGFVVLAPMRRGRGASEGDTSLSEPYTSCGYSENVFGVNSAIEDLDHVVAYAKTQPYIDLSRIVIGGVSRGGLLSVAYASKRPDLAIKGTVNFVGGWSNYRCDGVNEKLFQDAGEGSKIPSLWVYGEKDSNYSDDAIRAYFQIFQKGNPNATFRMHANVPQDGHNVSLYARFWATDLNAFLKQLGFAKLQ